jgi:hypothetical protein
MTEQQLQAAVVKLCKLYGLTVYHPWISIRSEPGWPDLFICGSAAIARELKREDGNATGAQNMWGTTLRRAGIAWDVWRPSDLHSGRIQRELEVLR